MFSVYSTTIEEYKQTAEQLTRRIVEKEDEVENLNNAVKQSLLQYQQQSEQHRSIVNEKDSLLEKRYISYLSFRPMFIVTTNMLNSRENELKELQTRHETLDNDLKKARSKPECTDSDVQTIEEYVINQCSEVLNMI